jgi:hypothetical protein
MCQRVIFEGLTRVIFEGLNMCKAGPEGYMAENIPVYAYTGIYTGVLGEKGYMGFFGGPGSIFRAWVGAHLSE